MSMPPMPQTRYDLDRAQCGTPGCTHEDHSEMFLHSACHPRAGHRVSYHLITGTLEIRCRICHQLAAEIAVAAPRPEQDEHLRGLS